MTRRHAAIDDIAGSAILDDVKREFSSFDTAGEKPLTWSFRFSKVRSRFNLTVLGGHFGIRKTGIFRFRDRRGTAFHMELPIQQSSIRVQFDRFGRPFWNSILDDVLRKFSSFDSAGQKLSTGAFRISEVGSR